MATTQSPKRAFRNCPAPAFAGVTMKPVATEVA